jgi:hypothetical protein
MMVRSNGVSIEFLGWSRVPSAGAGIGPRGLFDLDTLIFCSPFLARRSFALSARPFFGQPLSRFCCSLISVGGRHERKSMKSMKSMIFYFIFFGSLARQAPDKLTP